MAKHARAGQRIDDIYTASWFVEQNKRREKELRNKQFGYSENPIQIIGSTESEDIEQYRPVGIEGPLEEQSDWTDPLQDPAINNIKCAINSDPTPENWGIAQGPINEFHDARVTLVGLTWAYFEMKASDDTHVTFNGTDLESDTEGVARIISAPYTNADPVTYPYSGIGMILIIPVGGGSSVEAGFARTPPEGIPAASDDGTDLTYSVASCIEMEVQGAVISPTGGSNIQIYSDLVNASVPGNVVIGWLMRDGLRFIDLGNCPPPTE